MLLECSGDFVSRLPKRLMGPSMVSEALPCQTRGVDPGLSIALPGRLAGESKPHQLLRWYRIPKVFRHIMLKVLWAKTIYYGLRTLQFLNMDVPGPRGISSVGPSQHPEHKISARNPGIQKETQAPCPGNLNQVYLSPKYWKITVFQLRI